MNGDLKKVSNESAALVSSNVGTGAGGALQLNGEMAKLQIQYNLLTKENNHLLQKQESMKEELRLAKVQSDNEKRLNRELKNEQANFYSRRNQLEELFLNCVEETRKDIERRRAVTLARANNLNSSLHMGTKKHDDSLASAIKNEQFTASDKRKVLELLLSNENVLLFLYEKLFPRAMTTENLLSQAQHLQGTNDHSYTTANMGFHQRAKSSTVRMPKSKPHYSKS